VRREAASVQVRALDADYVEERSIAMIDRLIEEIFEKHRAYPPATDSLIAKVERRTGYALPADLKRFYTRCNGAVLFAKEDAFSYRILPLEKIKRTRIYIFGPDNDNDDLAPASWYAICDLMEGNYVGIDFASIAPDNKTCSIIDCFHETHGIPGGQNKIIAKSFTEFLQRALNGGEDPYWLQPGFKGYGEALEAEAR
jgi:cell wall assembly regulator SMI1